MGTDTRIPPEKQDAPQNEEDSGTGLEGEEYKRRVFKVLFQDFIESYPLYKKLKLGPYAGWSSVFPMLIYRPCGRCRKEYPFKTTMTFGGGAGMPDPPKPKSEIYGYHYACTACGERYSCWVEVNFEKGWVWKVGQVPMWFPQISKEVEEDLGEDVELYKKALRCMAESYGLGACAYFRSLLEHHVHPLLQTLYEIRKADSAPEEELQRVLDTMGKKDFTSKIELAYKLLPPSIIVDGENPIKLMHDELSKVLHDTDDDEAMEVALKVQAALEYVVVELNRQQKAKTEFISRIRSIKPKK